MFAERIKKLRSIYGYSQKEVATKLNLNQSQVAKWEKHDLEPSLATLYAIGQLFDVTTDYLIGLDGATVNLNNLIQNGIWLKFFIDNPNNEKILQFKKECENFELNYGNDIEFKKLTQKEKIVFFAKEALSNISKDFPNKDELNYKEYIAAQALRNEIVMDNNFFEILYEILPEKNGTRCPNYFEVKNKILNYYSELQPYRDILNFF